MRAGRANAQFFCSHSKGITHARPFAQPGILAHVGAGKTTLTERLLHLAGVIDEPGRSTPVRPRPTRWLWNANAAHLKAAVVAFPVGDTTVNVVDTPGHPDFISEVSGFSLCSMAPCWCSQRSKAFSRRPGS